VGVQAALQGPIADQTPPIGLRAEHVYELTPPGDEFAQALGRDLLRRYTGFRRRLDRALDRLSRPAFLFPGAMTLLGNERPPHG